MREPERLENYYFKRFARRGLLIGGLQAAIGAALALRMRHLQIEQADQYKLLADENRINIRLISPIRGEIFDSKGIKLALNEPNYRIIIVKENTKDIDLSLIRLSKLITITEAEIKRTKEELSKSPKFLPVVVLDRVSWEDIALVAFNTPVLPGITTEVGLSRKYPLKKDFAHIVGYVGPVSKNDLRTSDIPSPLLKLPRFHIGKVGIEEKLENELRGHAGSKQVEVNSEGRIMRELKRQAGVSGKNIQITVNSTLQSFVQARLGSESASAVVMDCQNGEILCIASSPSYNPNKFVKGISYAEYSLLNQDEKRPLASKTVQDAYPPGSTFKMIVALAALKEGILSPSDTIICTGHAEISERKFLCWKLGGHGKVALKKSIIESCDVFFYELALRLGIEKISQMAQTFGIGVKHNIPMSAETSGLAPTKEWKLEKRGKEWVIGDTVNAAIGQGNVLSSPLQLAVMTARLATGTNLEPKLIKSVEGQTLVTKKPSKIKIKDQYLQIIKNAMFDVSNNRKGTAYSSRIVADQYRMAGKTGTSQVFNITEKERRMGVIANEDREWHRRDHALFVCFAPYEDPKVAVSVVVEHGGGGSKIAAPIGRDITLQALYGEDPPLSAYPVKDRELIKIQQTKIREKLGDDDKPQKGSV